MKYKIEIVGPLNERVAFPPVGKVLRGAWYSHVVAMKDKAAPLKELSQIPEIPGMIVAIDTTPDSTGRCKGAILDGLTSPQGKAIQPRLEEIFKRNTAQLGTNYAPAEREEYELYEDDVKNWMYWMRRLSDLGFAKKYGNDPELPTLDEIRQMPGKRLNDPWNTGPQAKELAKVKWADVVEEEGTVEG